MVAVPGAPSGLITELFAQLDQMNEELGYFEPRSSRWASVRYCTAIRYAGGKF
jgi:hypothetical protein